MINNVTKTMEVAIEAAIGAGEILQKYFGDSLAIKSKDSLRDIVTQADYTAEDQAIAVVQNHFPNVYIVSEERGETGIINPNEYWLIDALDGTVNFVHNIPFFAVSVAFIKNAETQSACIYVPMMQDLYYAGRGIGAYKNKEKLSCKDVTVEQSLFATSFSGKSFDPSLREQEFLTFGRINDLSCGCLRTGSAALNLVFLSEGKFNGCWGKANKHWDIAAGLLIAEEAGLRVYARKTQRDSQRINYIVAPNTNFEFLMEQVNLIFE